MQVYHRAFELTATLPQMLLYQVSACLPPYLLGALPKCHQLSNSFLGKIDGTVHAGQCEESLINYLQKREQGIGRPEGQ